METRQLMERIEMNPKVMTGKPVIKMHGSRGRKLAPRSTPWRDAGNRGKS